MGNYALMNPGKYHLGTRFDFPPKQNRTYRSDNRILDIKWKTSALLGRRIYVGNVKITDKDGVERVLSDSVFKSKSNQFDVFTTDRRIDVAVGDGEQVIKLVSYADRLLEFKENTLYIINATKASEYLEGSFKFKGVSHPSAVCVTDYGIVWCNSHGVYYFDGEGVNELFIKKGRRIISDSTWTSFYLEGQTMIGYVPDTKQLILIRGNDTTVDNIGNIMVYNMAMQSWTKGTNRLGENSKSNIVNLWDGRPVYADATSGNVVTIYPWDPNVLSSINNYKVETREIDFGTQSKKKVSKVRIAYKGGNGPNDNGTDVPTNVLPKYAINNGSFEHSFQDSNDSNITNIPGSVDWTEIDLFTQSNANNIRSFSIQLTDVSGEDVVNNFEINDITIIYRQKSVK